MNKNAATNLLLYMRRFITGSPWDMHPFPLNSFRIT